MSDQNTDIQYENWVYHVEYPNYMISDLGNVYNVRKSRYLKLTMNSNGYLYVRLSKKNKSTLFRVNVLVGKCFLTKPNKHQKFIVDHIDGVKYNNTLKNLRYVTPSQNCMNRVLNKTSTTGVKGVTFVKERNKYHARISIDGIHIHIGYYVSLKEAQIARVIRACEIFGEFTNGCESIGY